MEITVSFRDKRTILGTLVRVGGEGILFLGEPGTGKSTAALELLLSGHRLIADDVVQIERVGDKLIGSAPDRLKGIISVPRLGIFDVRDVLGAEYFWESSAIDRCFVLGAVASGQRRSILGLSLPTSKRVVRESDVASRFLSQIDRESVKRSEMLFTQAHDRQLAAALAR